MLSVEDRYYKFNRILLKAAGMWPYRKSKWNYVQMITITTLYLSVILLQFAILVTHDCSLELFINVISFALPSVSILCFYHVYYFRADAFKEIIEHMYYDWKCLKNKMEVDILDDYACVAKLLTEIFMFFAFIGVSWLISIRIVPTFLNIVLHTNESRPIVLHIKMEYFVDQYKYNYLFVIHLSTYLCLALLTTMAVITAIYSYGLHACGVFKIINYRMKVMMNKDILRIPSPERERVIFERLVRAVNLHRRNLLFCNMLMSQLEKPLFMVLIIGVVSVSTSMFRILQAVVAYTDIVEIILPLTLISSHIVFVFFGNHFGQQITNNNAEIFDTVYKLQWYVVSLDIQKLMLFLLQNGYKDLYISIGGVFNASYESFTMFITTALSYFTVLYTVY